MDIGYARIATNDQRALALQLDALRQRGCQQIFTDEVGSVRDDRPGLRAALSFVQAGDTLVVWRLDRLSQSLLELIRTVHRLGEQGVGFKSLTETIDTTTLMGQLLFSVFNVLVEFEHNLMGERTQAGLNAARTRGRKGGRPNALSEAKQQQLCSLYDSKEYPIAVICQMMGISKSTLYAYVKERGRR